METEFPEYQKYQNNCALIIIYFVILILTLLFSFTLFTNIISFYLVLFIISLVLAGVMNKIPSKMSNDAVISLSVFIGFAFFFLVFDGEQELKEYQGGVHGYALVKFIRRILGFIMLAVYGPGAFFSWFFFIVFIFLLITIGYDMASKFQKKNDKPVVKESSKSSKS